MANPKIVYIAGYGRSGTTLLSIVLGQHRSILGAGEISELALNAWIQNTYCSCGAPMRECEFWGKIVRRWVAGNTEEAMQVNRQRQIRFERPLARFRGAKAADFRPYAELTERLYSLISEQSRQDIIVDSSKVPWRASTLARMPGLDLYVVHMVRDGRGVAWSLMKSYKKDVKAGLQRDITPKSPVRTGIRWSMVNLAAERLRKTVRPGRYLRVRYEDFVDDPVATLGQIGEMIGVDLDQVAKGIRDGEPIKPHHQLAGNRLRMSSSITLEIDDSWKSQMPLPDQRMFNRLFGWLLKRYGYN
jgi:Sulfotransferase family